MTQLAITARIEVAEKDAPAFLEAARKIIEPTRAEAGCELYALAVDVTAPNVFWFSEQWADKANLDDHLRSAHIADFMGVVGTLELLGMEARQYTVDAIGDVEMPEQ